MTIDWAEVLHPLDVQIETWSAGWVSVVRVPACCALAATKREARARADEIMMKECDSVLGY